MKTLSLSKIKYLILILLVNTACNQGLEEESMKTTEVRGETMGTTYMVKYVDSTIINIRPEIDSILVDINLELSTYIDSSLISRLNQAGADTFLLKLHENYGPARHFPQVYIAAHRIYEASTGSFDPTVMPVVNYWGFGYKDTGDPRLRDSMLIDSLRQIVGMDKLGELRDEKGNLSGIIKTDQRLEVDFSAIAKGYAVDYIGKFLESKGIQNYLVEIGGEVRARGENEKGDLWTVGINIPDPTARLSDFVTRLRLDDASCATSGNYRNYIEIDGIQYGHTINPLTALPEINRLLSASIVADDCMTADGWATACMVMGFEKCRDLITKEVDIEGLLIYSVPEEGVSIWRSDNFPTISETNQK